ncbi:histidine kinase N-terminal 7TM domain-containing protein [Patescibacteria group bacterium]
MENIALNINALLSLGAAMIIFLFGLFVLLRNPYSSVNKFFGAYAMSVAWWAFGLGMAAASLTPQETLMWGQLASVGGILMGPMLYMFILAFTGSRLLENALVLFFFVGVSFIIFFVSIFVFPYSPGDLILSPQGIWDTPDIRAMEHFSNAWVTLIIFFAIYLCWKFYTKTRDEVMKKQALLIFVAISIPVFFGVLSRIVVPILQIDDRGFSGILFSFSSLILIFPLAYAILKYRLFSPITPEATAEVIISTMKDILIITNEKLEIEFVNPFALHILGYRQGEITGKPVSVLFSSKDWKKTIKSTISKIKEGEEVMNVEVDVMDKNKKLIPISLSADRLEAGGKTLIGIVIVAKDIRETKKLVEELEKKSEELALKIKDLEVVGTTTEKTRLATLNILEDVEEARADLQGRVDDLEKFNKLAVGRELKMIDLKEEIKRLKESLKEK